MLHTNEQIIKLEVGLLNLAEEPGKVSKPCWLMGLSLGTCFVGTRKGVGCIYQ